MHAVGRARVVVFGRAARDGLPALEIVLELRRACEESPTQVTHRKPLRENVAVGQWQGVPSPPSKQLIVTE